MSHPSRVRGLKLLVLNLTMRGFMSHPSRVRGLKLYITKRNHYVNCVAPLAGAWIETDSLVQELVQVQSHPSRVRGLKQVQSSATHHPMRSHPSRVRGLKHRYNREFKDCLLVAPLAGAWIETMRRPGNGSARRSRTPRGCVD